eukprot:COSAG02_NODE_3129_length_7312_cov_338.294191_2_plen_66_part_00
MAVCQARGQRDGRLPGTRPAQRAAAHPALAKFRRGLGQSRVGGGRSWAAADQVCTNIFLKKFIRW